MPMDEYREANLANWNDRVPIHAASQTYDLDRFRAGRDDISTVVDFDRHSIGDVAGKRLLHLQCHIGTDTVSWGRLGATVTGYDFSEPAIEQARVLAERMELGDARFVVGEFYDAPQVLAGERFDVVYTGVGALCWLPDIRRWAEVVERLLEPGGVLLIREAHPVLWALDHDREDDELVLAVPYFETREPLRWDDTETYTETGEAVEHATTYEWNHGIGEILTSVLDVGLRIRRFEEHRHLEWQAWHLFQEESDTGRYVLPAHLRDRVPLSYTLVAEKPAS